MSLAASNGSCISINDVYIIRRLCKNLFFFDPSFGLQVILFLVISLQVTAEKQQLRTYI
jgi:hypothetical protein